MSIYETVYLKNCRLEIYNSEYAGRGILYFLAAERIDLEVRDKVCLVMIFPYDWNYSMTPWKYPGKGMENTGGGVEFAKEFERDILYKYPANGGDNVPLIGIGGYSLGGLEAMYISTRDVGYAFAGSISGSMWYPDAEEFLSDKLGIVKNCYFYFSLGDKEALTKNSERALVREKTEKIVSVCESANKVVYELNPGGHFTDIKGRIERCIYIFDQNINIQVMEDKP